MPPKRSPMSSIFRSLEGSVPARKSQRGTHYSLEIRTRFRGSRGFWPAPVELHTIFEVRQLEQGDRLSHRI
jgi:hypothetical protein